jgi:8-oxo-dGTP pyrophosphatase MutT (NUDIX family)
MRLPPKPNPEARGVRPRDAAGLVLLREGSGGLEVLLGRRARTSAFLPDIFVFPGGRVERQDAEPLDEGDRLPDWAVRTLPGGTGPSGDTLARTAIRETYEETGLMMGRPLRGAASGPMPSPWRAFGDAGLRPATDQVVPIARAITPSYSRRRFHTRFFLGDGRLARGAIAGNGELDDIAWWPVGQVGRLGLVDVTEFVLAEALRRWPVLRPARARVPLWCYRGKVARLIRS